MIRIHSIDAEPISELRYLNARSGGGSEVSRLPFLRAHVDAFASDKLDAIVCCSDLQGVVAGTLLGVAVANHLAELADDGVLPPSPRTGIVLAGDLYSVPAANKRGGFGDVAVVWEELASLFPWVVGVAGNHDDITNVIGLPGCHVLDGTSVDGKRFRAADEHRTDAFVRAIHPVCKGRVYSSYPRVERLAPGDHCEVNVVAHQGIRETSPIAIEQCPAKQLQVPPPFVFLLNEPFAINKAGNEVIDGGWLDVSWSSRHDSSIDRRNDNASALCPRSGQDGK